MNNQRHDKLTVLRLRAKSSGQYTRKRKAVSISEVYVPEHRKVLPSETES
jgi:hypothetical protein